MVWDVAGVLLPQAPSFSYGVLDGRSSLIGISPTCLAGGRVFGRIRQSRRAPRFSEIKEKRPTDIRDRKTPNRGLQAPWDPGVRQYLLWSLPDCSAGCRTPADDADSWDERRSNRRQSRTPGADSMMSWMFEGVDHSEFGPGRTHHMTRVYPTPRPDVGDRIGLLVHSRSATHLEIPNKPPSESVRPLKAWPTDRRGLTVDLRDWGRSKRSVEPRLPAFIPVILIPPWRLPMLEARPCLLDPSLRERF
jgi:hypothetical protein